MFHWSRGSHGIVFTCIFHKKHSGDKFFCKKNVRNAVLRFLMNIIILNKSHKLLIIETWLIPRWKIEFFFHTAIIFTNCNYHIVLITACLLQFQCKISQKYSHVMSILIIWLNFRNNKAKWLPSPCLTCVKIGKYLQIN